MNDRHHIKAISVRPDTSLAAWLTARAVTDGLSERQLILVAVRYFRLACDQGGHDHIERLRQARG